MNTRASVYPSYPVQLLVMLTCLMVAPSSTSTACFSFGVFTCTVIFPLPCKIKSMSQIRPIKIPEHQVLNQAAASAHLCSLRHGAACSADCLALLCNKILSKLQSEQLCLKSALINPEAAGVSSALLLLMQRHGSDFLEPSQITQPLHFTRHSRTPPH